MESMCLTVFCLAILAVMSQNSVGILRYFPAVRKDGTSEVRSASELLTDEGELENATASDTVTVPLSDSAIRPSGDVTVTTSTTTVKRNRQFHEHWEKDRRINILYDKMTK